MRPLRNAPWPVWLLCLFFAACSSGGGGGGAPSLPPDPRQVDPPDLNARQQRFAESAEFAEQSALSQIGAGYAYARGATGAGETLVIVDSGLQANHREFAGKRVQISGHPNTPGYRAGIAQSSHGTATAGVAAARRDLDTAVSRNMHGVAFDADVHMVNIPLGSAPPTYTPLPLSAFSGRDDLYWESLLGYAAGLGAIVNLSLGFPGAISEPAYTRTEVRRVFARTAAALAQAGTPDAEKSIFVWAAGNAGQSFTAAGEAARADAPELLGGLGVHFPELRSHVLAVVALGDRPGASGQLEIASFSNHCGIARDFCLAAPGLRLTAPATDTSRMDRYRSFSGTSAAAPVVSGALAVLRHRFRNGDGSCALGNTELVARLLATADRTGVFANSDIYGRGKLDLNAATRPSGAVRLLLGETLAGPAAPESLSALAPGAAFGDALSSALARRQVAAFDSLDAPFRRSLASYLPAQSGARRSLPEQLRAQGGDPRGAALAMSGGGVLRLHASRAADAAGAADALRSAGAPPFPQPGNFAHAATASAAQLDSLWFSQSLGASGAGVFLGLRGHPGWDFGLHAAGAVSPGQFSDSGAFANPYLSFARAGGVAGVAAPAAGGVLRAAAFRGGAQWGALRDPDAAQAFGGVLEFQAGSRARGAALSAGMLREPERLMGSRQRGAFGGGGGRSWFAGASAHWPLTGAARGGLRGFASLHAGYTRAAPRAGVSQSAMLSWQAPLWSSAWAVGVSRRGVLAPRDQLSLRLSQPLRVERGRAALRWISGRHWNGDLHIERAELPLAPSGRQLEAELSYARDLAGGMLNISALGTRHPGHNASAAAEFALLLRYALRF